MPPASKRPRTAEEGDGSTPLERKWAAQFKALSPKRQVGVLQRRKEFGHSGLLLDADAPPKQAVASFATQLSAWCPEATSVSVARGGSGGVALGLADTFDILHAFAELIAGLVPLSDGRTAVVTVCTEQIDEQNIGLDLLQCEQVVAFFVSRGSVYQHPVFLSELDIMLEILRLVRICLEGVHDVKRVRKAERYSA